MKTCPSCGGIIGQDCFNPDECAWITQAQEAAQRQKVDDLQAYCIMLEARLQELTQKIDDK